MTNKLVKVDRVRSAEEAATVERWGADLVGVSLDEDPRFDDGRYVLAQQAAVIGEALRNASLVAAMDLADDPQRILELAATAGAGMVQPIAGAVPPPAVRKALTEKGIGIVYGGIEIAHDDDPGWIFSSYADTADLGAALFQAEVLPEYRDSWAFLRERAPEYDDEFQIADLEELARERPLLVGLDFTPDNVREIVVALPGVRGIAFTLAEQARRGDARFHTYADTLDVLRAL